MEKTKVEIFRLSPFRFPLSKGAVAQWESTGFASQGLGVRPPSAPLFLFLAAFPFWRRVRRWRVRWSSSISCAWRASSHLKTSKTVNLARCFSAPVRNAKPQAAKLMFSHHALIKILGFRPKGTSFIFKNIEKLPKGPSFAEGDRFFWVGVRGQRSEDRERSMRVPVALFVGFDH
jgi:hypothetical protein